MQHFEYRQNQMYCEDVPLRELAEEFGTPLYVYSKNQILDNYCQIRSAFGAAQHTICYAFKANSNLSILKILAEEGAGADVVSAGELYLALKAGFSPEKIAFAGVGKREDEIEYALREQVYSINAESIQEMQLISLIAMRNQTKARISIRVNPNIDAQSHPYISTGLRQHKFGISAEDLLQVYQFAVSLPSVEVIGVHTHIGSQIVKVEPYAETAAFIAETVRKLREVNIPLHHIDFGGGFGVQYVNAIAHEALPKEDMALTYPAMHEFMQAVLPVLEPLGCSIWMEPGRSIVANAGVLLTKILYTKENGAKKFVIVDAGMNDMLRPSLYNAHHQIVPLTIETYEHERVDVVGPLCESGDFFARDRLLSKPKRNEFLSLMTTGAYGFVNTSNYNSRLRPAEILVNGDRVRVIRERETFEDLL
ncbi:MAG: diaminopimelate decarboxylase [bacterium]